MTASTFTIAKSDFGDLLSLASPYFSAKERKLYMCVKNSDLYLFASAAPDGGSVLISRLIGKIEDHPWVAIDGNIRDLVMLLDDDTSFDVAFTETSLMVVAPNSKSEFRFLSRSAPPHDAFAHIAYPVSMRGNNLNILAALTEAASEEDARPTLAGVFIAPHKGNVGNLEAAAADGYILSYTNVRAEVYGIESETGAVYSVKALQKARLSLRATQDDKIRIGFGDTGNLFLNMCRGGYTEVTVEIPMKHRDFVDYKQVLSFFSSSAIEVEIPVDSLERMLRRMKAIDANVYIQVVDGQFCYLIQNEKNGRILERICVEATKESPLMSFQFSTLRDALKACVPTPTEKVKVIFPEKSDQPLRIIGAATTLAMPLACDLKESPFKAAQPALI